VKISLTVNIHHVPILSSGLATMSVFIDHKGIITMKTVYYNHYRAKNDNNGNPRQFVEIYNEDGTFINVIKFSYVSHYTVVEKFIGKTSEIKTICVSNHIQVTPKCYKERTINALNEN
jgi:hypothetical protein